MPDSLPEAFDAPVFETIGGAEQELPLLDLDDLAKISALTLARQKHKAMAKIDAEDHDKVRSVVTWYDRQEATIDDVVRYVGTFTGTVDALVASMGKAGVGKPEAKAKVLRLARERGWTYAVGLAMRVATLFGQPGPGPNPTAGESPADGSDGGSLEASSSATPDAPQAP